MMKSSQIKLIQSIPGFYMKDPNSQQIVHMELEHGRPAGNHHMHRMGTWVRARCPRSVSSDTPHIFGLHPLAHFLTRG